MIYGTSLVCINIVLNFKKVYLTTISIKTPTENNEKDDIDEAIIHYFKLMLDSSHNKTIDTFKFKLTYNFILPELKPPRRILCI